MKRSLAVLAAFVGLSLLGCGAPTGEAESLAEASQELSTCTATANCSGGQTVSCSGNSTCSTTDYQGVTCDGVFKACPVDTCEYSTQCEALEGQRCIYKPSQPPVRVNCCYGTWEAWCVCSSTGRYVCV